jgi:hypothetical protein
MIIIVLAIIVLISLLTLFGGVLPSANSAVNSESAKNGACQVLMSKGCDNINTAQDLMTVPVNGVSGAANMAELCRTVYLIPLTDVNGCKALCGCTASTNIPPRGPPSH